MIHISKLTRAAAVTILVGGTAAAQSQPDAVSLLHWMAGCWEGVQDGGTMEEHWTAPAGGTMLGTSRIVKDGKTVFTEFMQIHDDGGVAVMTVALGIGKPGTAFRARPTGDGEIVFENPAHDFPQRVIYRRAADGGLRARIEGTQNGKAGSEDFTMTRGRCPGV